MHISFIPALVSSKITAILVDTPIADHTRNMDTHTTKYSKLEM